MVINYLAGGDQGLLNLYFSDWASREDNTRRLPFIYNMTSSASYFYRPAYKQFVLFFTLQ